MIKIKYLSGLRNSYSSIKHMNKLQEHWKKSNTNVPNCWRLISGLNSIKVNSKNVDKLETLWSKHFKGKSFQLIKKNNSFLLVISLKSLKCWNSPNFNPLTKNGSLFLIFSKNKNTPFWLSFSKNVSLKPTH